MTTTRETRDMTLLLVRAKERHFQPEFRDWLVANWAIWERFVDEARKIKQRGRVRYSARTIIEYIRHETALSETAGDFKINNNAAPDMSRLYALVTGDSTLFETRGRM